MMIDLKTVLAWKPYRECPPERLAELFITPKTPREVLTITAGKWAGVQPRDRLWMVLHGGILPDRVLRLFACMFAERSLLRERAAGREPHADSWRAVAVARKFANGDATEAELKAAERAARAAADRAASDMAASRELAACWSVALDAETAAMESAWLAVLDAEIAALESAWSVAWETRFDAVCAGVDAERKSQVWDLLALMDKEKLP